VKFPVLGKVFALGAVLMALLLGLESISGIVAERQGRQLEAEQSVTDSLAGAQTVLGPVLQRRCVETWERVDGEGKDRKTLSERRDVVLSAWPRTLKVAANADIEPRYRGLFKLNSHLTKATLSADWPNLEALQPRADHAGSQLRCELPTVAVAVSDARGIQTATMQAAALRLNVLPGSLMKGRAQGFHAVLNEAESADPLHLDIGLNLAGTRSIAWVPIADESRVQLASNWPHPSFAGRFLPVERRIGEAGFEAQWQVSSLATTAQQAALNGAGLCEPRDLAQPAVLPGEDSKPACLDSFGVSFIDPVNAYVLSDRALKYGLLFIVLTFVGVALVEVLHRVRVHPVQYGLVGGALTLFFLIVLSLSEHLAFGWAYLAGSAACVGLLGFYAAHILKGLRAGLAFGAGIATLFGALYALLQLEQTALPAR